MPDDQVQFLSPTTGKVQPVSSEDWDEALKQGYQPVSHKVMYSPDGKRGMVPNEDLHDYIKQGYQTTPKTQFENERTPGYRSAEDIEFAKTIGLKPTNIAGVTNAAMLGVGAGGVGRAIAKQGLKAVVKPLAKGIIGATAGGATGHYLGNLVGMPGEGAAVGGLVGGLAGGFGGEKVPTPEPDLFPTEGMTSSKVPIGNAPLPSAPASEPTPFPQVQKLSDIKAAQRAAAKAAELAARKGGMTAPPSPFQGMTSSANVSAGAPVPQGSPTPFQPISQGAMTKTAPYTEVPGITSPRATPPLAVSEAQPTSLLSRGRTLVTPGAEPDLNNPVHAKMINDYQTMSGADKVLPDGTVQPGLRTLAKQGDRFAAFVLRHMPRP